MEVQQCRLDEDDYTVARAPVLLAAADVDSVRQFYRLLVTDGHALAGEAVRREGQRAVAESVREALFTGADVVVVFELGDAVAGYNRYSGSSYSSQWASISDSKCATSTASGPRATSFARSFQLTTSAASSFSKWNCNSVL